jgi:hypothetical protein
VAYTFIPPSVAVAFQGLWVQDPLIQGHKWRTTSIQLLYPQTQLQSAVRLVEEPGLEDVSRDGRFGGAASCMGLARELTASMPKALGVSRSMQRDAEAVERGIYCEDLIHSV